MNDVFKRIVILFVVLILSMATISVAYFSNLFKHSRTIEDVDHLSGQRIGVITAYEGDFLLSDREDITLLRYETQPEVLIALCYKQVDAIAFTREMAEYVVNVCTGFKINDKPIAKNNLASLYQDDSKYIGEFEEFLQEYKKSGEYDKFLESCENNAFYDGSPITEETGTGEVVRIGYILDFLPVVFEDTINHCPNGFEVEIMRQFANYKNYQIEWVKETETSGLSDVYYGKIDILLSGYTDIYRKECDNSEYVDLGPSYLASDIVLLEVEDYDNIVMGELPEE